LGDITHVIGIFMRRSLFCSAVIPLSMFMLAGCDLVVDGSRSRASLTERAFYDAKSAWTDIFTYHPKEEPNAPQTRYCYQMMTDVVCYDSVQPGLTAKLVGYQDGNHVSWVQPGGGSLGASGGNPVALKPKTHSARSRSEVIEVKKPLEYTAVEAASPTAGEIESVTLPASR
jgi:hypothetical protein